MVGSVASVDQILSIYTVTRPATSRDGAQGTEPFFVVVVTGYGGVGKPPCKEGLGRQLDEGSQALMSLGALAGSDMSVYSVLCNGTGF